MAAIILVPLTILIVAFSVANRQDVTISFDPFGPNSPAAWQTQHLFVVIIVVLILGVIVGGVAVWLRQTKWRRAARRLEREVANLRAEVEALRRSSVPVHIPETAESAERLRISPPIR
ncbi:MAG TPA: lipopolysaccharide assembly protein LapA domain-containing protein [Pseudolabrys sp.]|nr:lipopolysaccharide assembly protein LapA domain-containing protein [Pseudolabrys sp.]